MNSELSHPQGPQSIPPADDQGRSEYEPPRVESVLTSEDLEREVHYAGTVGTGFPPV